MTEFERALLAKLQHVGDGLHALAKAVEHAPDHAKEIDDAGSAIERGLSEVATSIDNLEMNR